MKKSEFKSYDDLPLFLNAELVAQALGIAPSSSAFLVYCYLRQCADRKTYQCYPSYETIGDAVC